MGKAGSPELALLLDKGVLLDHPLNEKLIHCRGCKGMSLTTSKEDSQGMSGTMFDLVVLNLETRI